MTREEEVIAFLDEHVFQPVLSSPSASQALKGGVRLTRARLLKLRAEKMVQYYWSAIGGTTRSSRFARQMRQEGFKRFEECIDDFRDRFGNKWLAK